MVGVDEVGRGCLAGPLLVVAARSFDELPAGLTDSKLLSRVQRENLFTILIKVCQFGEGWVKAQEIDNFGLSRALRLGVKRALLGIGAQAGEKIIMDGNVNYVPRKYISSKCVTRADLNIPIVSAAGIYAKVCRDAYMSEFRRRYPAYGFENHVGYGTLAHRKAIASLGPIKSLHRMSFRPFRLLQER